jgi:signal recognition particle subunit SRP72
MPPPSATARKAKQGKAKGRTSTRKATPKKPVSEAETARQLFSSLCSQIDGAHFANAIKTCDKSVCLYPTSLPQKAHLDCVVLRIYPDDIDALSTKLFLLLQIDQYQSALTVIDGSKNKSELAFENAYALYRSHESVSAHEATKSLKEKNPEDRGLAHLEAQLVRLFRHFISIRECTRCFP